MSPPPVLIVLHIIVQVWGPTLCQISYVKNVNILIHPNVLPHLDVEEEGEEEEDYEEEVSELDDEEDMRSARSHHTETGVETEDSEVVMPVSSRPQSQLGGTGVSEKLKHT